jgi:hypothetical protein
MALQGQGMMAFLEKVYRNYQAPLFIGTDNVAEFLGQAFNRWAASSKLLQWRTSSIDNRGKTAMPNC